MKLLSDYITSHFTYDPVTGLISNSKTGKTYTEATHHKGYITIGVRHKITNTRIAAKAHRLAWFLYYGVDPVGVIDHIDHDKINNKITNLQDVSNIANCQNRVKRQSSCCAGVTKRENGNYRAKARPNKTTIQLGTYASMTDAHYVSTLYKSLFYENYRGFDLTDIGGAKHPYFVGTLHSIVSNITDTSGTPAFKHIF